MKNSWKRLFVAPLLLALLFFSGCSEGFKIGLVTDTGKINDKGFNQSAWEGVQNAAKSLSLPESSYKYIESKDTTSYEANIEKLVKEGSTIIVTVGFPLAEITAKMAKKYPNVRFIGVDQFRAPAEKPEDKIENYVGLIFPEKQGGYLAGALAALLSKTNKVAAVLGTKEVPPIVNFKEGFEAGAKATKSGIEVLTKYYPGGADKAFTDPNWGAKTAKNFLDNGADVIFAAAGKTGNGALEATATEKSGGKDVYCIGVDVDQWETVSGAHPCLVSSAMKLVSASVSDLIQKAHKETFPAGGNHTGNVGLAPFHDFSDTIPSSAKEQLQSIETKLKSGEIKIP